MEQKIVSFKVATALKDAGYPQCGDWWYSENGGLSDDWIPEMMYCAAPAYIDVWLWMWREKKACIGILFDDGDCAVEIWSNKSFLRDFDSRFDPEEAIINAIEFLVDNDLIK